MNKFKLVCFDVDGTLVDGVSWIWLTEGLGCSSKKHIDIFNRATRGEISFTEGERMLTRMYKESGNATRKFIRNLFSEIKPRLEAAEVIFYLKKKNHKVYLISGAIDIYVEAIAEKLEVDGFYANSSLEFDKEGTLSKIHYRDNQGEVKVEQLRELIEKLKIKTDEVVFVGDSENDIEISKETRHGVAVNSSSEELKSVAWKNIFSLEQIKDIL